MCHILSDKENRICLTAQPDGVTIIYLLFYFKQCKSDIRYFTEVYTPHKILSTGTLTARVFHNEQPQVNVQNRVARNLCTPVVLMCLELLSKRTEIFIIQITS